MAWVLGALGSELRLQCRLRCMQLPVLSRSFYREASIIVKPGSSLALVPVRGPRGLGA